MGQQLKKISDHVWVYTFDSPKDRPNLGYIHGSRMSMAVDAGHSSSHVADFYCALEEHDLPLPALTAITHWHWDHTFGMHAVNGKTIARFETNRELAGILAEMKANPMWESTFLNSDPSIRREYQNGRIRVVPVLADEELRQEKSIDLGSVTARLLFADSPHTDDALLVHVPEDRVLFIGDAQLGQFPSWRMDYDKLDRLARRIREIDAEFVVDGHWHIYRKQELLEEL